MSQLRELIADRIRTSGPISFAEFMELSLYHPSSATTPAPPRRPGARAIFLPASMSARSSANCSQAVRRDVAAAAVKRVRESKQSRVRESPEPGFDLVEAGAGNGRLACDVLDAAQRDDPEFYAAVRLSLVERSPAARDAQAEMLGAHARLLKHSAAELPADIHGVVLANELLDALPTHAVVMTDAGLREVHVEVADGRFVERLTLLRRRSWPTTCRVQGRSCRRGARRGEPRR